MWRYDSWAPGTPEQLLDDATEGCGETGQAREAQEAQRWARQWPGALAPQVMRNKRMILSGQVWPLLLSPLVSSPGSPLDYQS